MTMVKEMPKVKQTGEMKLTEIRQHLGRLRRGERIAADDLNKLHGKLRLILQKLAKVGAKGGKFSQVRASRELMELHRRSGWA